MRKRILPVLILGLLFFSISTYVLAQAPEGAQRGGGQRGAPPPLENIQVLKGMDRQQVIEQMAKIASQLGVQCTFCHLQNNFASDDVPQKQTAREMLRMVQVINDQPFFKNGDRKVECFTCHRAANKIPIAPPPPPFNPQRGGGRGAAPGTAPQAQ